MARFFPPGPQHFDFTTSVKNLCIDVTEKLPEFGHIDMSKVAVCFAQTRSRQLHGLQAKLTPLRFENGARTTIRNGRQWTVQRLLIGQVEMTYILTFYLPRFLDQSFKEKFVTILHELYHISPKFDGDIRRMEGRYHVHSHSQKEYDREMEMFSKQYLSLRPDTELFEFLRHDFKTLQATHGGIVGLQTPIPKLVPLADSRTA